jgi:hypothetical protein
MSKRKSYKVLALTTCAVIIISMVSLVFATINYLEFYVALNGLCLRMDAFNYANVDVGTTGGIRVNVTLVLIQNSSFVGLKLNSVYVRIFYYYEDGIELLFARRFWLEGESFDAFSETPLIVRNLNLTFAERSVMKFVELKERGETVYGTLTSCVFLYLFGNSYASKVDLDNVELTL